MRKSCARDSRFSSGSSSPVLRVRTDKTYDLRDIVAEKDKKKILVLGSGPIRIGQGIEFDFCSVHCTWAFAKEGYETIIINNNPETVSTDFDIADKLYFEPLTPEDVENVVNIEKPDGAVVQFGANAPSSAMDLPL